MTKQKFINAIQLFVTDPLLLAGAILLFAKMQGFSGWLTWKSLLVGGALEMACIYPCILLFHANRSLWRYAAAGDYMRLILAYMCGFVLAYALTKLFIPFTISNLFLLTSVSLSLLGSLFVRMLTHVFINRMDMKHSNEHPSSTDSRRNMIILGAGAAGVSLLNETQRNPAYPYQVQALLDDDPMKIGRDISGVTVRGQINKLPELLKTYPNTEVVLAIPSLDVDRRREIVAMCSKLSCQFRIMPDALLIMEHGGNYSALVRGVKIEDLLSRTTVSFSQNELDRFIRGKTILITGGGGSIGSELCRQVAGAGAKKLVIFDIYENDSYILYRELKHLFGNNLEIVVEIGDMTDKERLETIFLRHRPDIVFHAAAHKHVPLMENAAYEAVRNNIFGTFNVLQMVKKYAVPKFVLISTDKAVNPTNVMGATKRYCEMMCRAMACERDCSSDYIAVRFGNVLGSHGSVLPIFQLQLAHGGPITVTDKRVTRYFMTIPEAAGLVIKAAAMAERSDTYILDMGKPVNMWEMAENFVRLSGYEPYKEINIIETGLRPGEKLYEELLVNDEVHKSTSVSRIFVEKNSEFIKMEDILAGLDLLRRAMATDSDEAVVKILHKLVPTFKTPEEVNAKFEASSPAIESPQKRKQRAAEPAATACQG